RAAVDAAPLRLELLDDLHRRDFRRARDRAARETRRDEIERVHALCEPAFDRAHELVHARERLDVEQLARAHGARHAAFAQVVAQEIDDHHVLGAVLRARSQLLGELAVARGILRARPGALDRLRLYAPVAQAQEPLGRRADDLAVGQIEIGREWGRIYLAEAHVSVPRVALRLRLEPLR